MKRNFVFALLFASMSLISYGSEPTTHEEAAKEAQKACDYSNLLKIYRPTL